MWVPEIRRLFLFKYVCGLFTDAVGFYFIILYNTMGMYHLNVTRYSCQITRKLEFSRQIFETHTNIKFHENPSSGSRVVPCGQTDRHDEAKSRFSQFY